MGNNGGRPPNNLSGSSNLSSSFNSGLNTYGLNNSYGNTNGFSSGANSLNNSPQFNTTNNGLGNYHQKKEVPAWLGMHDLTKFTKFTARLMKIDFTKFLLYINTQCGNLSSNFSCRSDFK